ncbi:MAG: hypothetical protein ABJN42_07445 [Roseibium sp.]|uniref:hypothetical protein n=1 Tax=Roseibium sp. TaxID=1936156 RepID=UPI0032996A54
MLAADRLAEPFEAYTSMVATRDMLIFMSENSQNGLFDGALELMDIETVKALGDNLDEVAILGKERSAPEFDFAPLTEAFADHEIQEIAAGIFAREHAENPAFGGFLKTIGSDIALGLGEIISDWTTRYQKEEVPTP